MTCKDCIHAEKCKDYLAYKLDKAFGGIDGSEKPICELFKDKSIFIELLYKVGDIAYLITNEIIPIKITAIQINKGEIIQYYWQLIFEKCGEYRLTFGTNNRIIAMSEFALNGYFTENDIGKVVFFTKEQAEQALKEREND